MVVKAFVRVVQVKGVGLGLGHGICSLGQPGDAWSFSSAMGSSRACAADSRLQCVLDCAAMLRLRTLSASFQDKTRNPKSTDKRNTPASLNPISTSHLFCPPCQLKTSKSRNPTALGSLG